ncbi:dienelactone hydrolase family protein [Ponticoccus sp. SC2-23]|uniref:dienelactone hydrolase family protein n=1 Tax=Alexandriicola marinus TaxID=2081710 RepID=UPI000FD995A5|nr:dienelactone hydrolase family protein [Alexandriicola marinus]MBM1220010.1 dienelactone hydrolase family protein [Ponticoccus sp. SC6-9]MBM1224696.1 dienelactone hydrolase family protein [Ponticoccus sp. SC6-15]MBM1228209.1 dienelactone hydrolase family protein [Ponticoccus sp. SC6-38]MBM1234153.1 dienelactone hydrolase family protein [Ponticoccus sp. SC6-45]MBM1238711.1 dienelactone hydrolase family protein [Ponticoccus sp. SC6-49]MBM1242492.1 dienelactone hydrolase family protein [Pontic
MRITSILLASTVIATSAQAEDVSYTVGEESFTGYFAEAENAKGLVLIVHDWDGMTDYERQRADMLAEMGYNAFALDMFGDETPTETMDHRMAATGALYQDRDRMRALIEAGVQQAMGLSGVDEMVVMGYCFGGAVALEMARSDMSGMANGYATFHGGLGTPEGQGWDGDEPPVLVLHGGADTSISMQDVATLATELETAGTTYTIEVYSNAPHAFTVFGSDRYQERADLESWSSFSSFLEDHI